MCVLAGEGTKEGPVAGEGDGEKVMLLSCPVRVSFSRPIHLHSQRGYSFPSSPHWAALESLTETSLWEEPFSTVTPTEVILPSAATMRGSSQGLSVWKL